MATLTHALEHHARPLGPLVGVLSTLILTELQPKGWELIHHNSGANSYSLRGPRGEQYHFRARRPLDKIHVYDRYQLGRLVTVLETRADVVRFVREIQ